MKQVVVFCGSSPGKISVYRQAAEHLADVLSSKHCDLVYGGAKVGLMGVLADRMLANGRRVIGVIPESLSKVEIAHDRLTQLHVVNSMHERKALMAQLADSFILLPGGAGSLEEFFEIFTWAQLGDHHKPYGILNVNGYYDRLLSFLEHAVTEGFLKKHYLDTIMVSASPNELLNQLISKRPDPLRRWAYDPVT